MSKYLKRASLIWWRNFKNALDVLSEENLIKSETTVKELSCMCIEKLKEFEE